VAGARRVAARQRAADAKRWEGTPRFLEFSISQGGLLDGRGTEIPPNPAKCLNAKCLKCVFTRCVIRWRSPQSSSDKRRESLAAGNNGYAAHDAPRPLPGQKS